MMENGSHIPGPDGHGPLKRSFLLPASEWEFEDTLRGIGLRATGSHNAVLRDAIVPEENIADSPFGEPIAADPVLQRVPEIMLLTHAAVAVGIAEGAIGDLMDIANAGTRQQYMANALAETERFKEGLASLTAELKAAATLLTAESREVWSRKMESSLIL